MSPNGKALDGTDVKTGVTNHSVMCLLEPPCVKSNYLLVSRNMDGTFTPTFNLSATSTPKIVKFLKALKREANVFVSVAGKMDAMGAIVVASIKDAVVSGWGGG